MSRAVNKDLDQVDIVVTVRFFSNASRRFALISTPGMGTDSPETGVGKASPKPMAVVPTKTYSHMLLVAQS